jgi:5'-nucleotidase (lipoprotein e(P4) family)
MKNTIFVFLACTFLFAMAPGPVVSQAVKDTNPKTLAVLWQQTSAEYRALCYQAFNLATLRINEIPERELAKGKLALITDLDETILDNSAREAQLILEKQSHTSANWKEWTKLSMAREVPGAAEFLRFAHSKGISVFYVSNRDTGEIRWTIDNLKMLDLPDADTEHMLFLSNTSSKEERRQTVLKDYRVVMLLGDNLNDFSTVFEKKTIAERSLQTDKLKEEWGRQFIVLPNATYGEWENALYNYNSKLPAEKKDSIRIHLLKGYK